MKTTKSKLIVLLCIFLCACSGKNDIQYNLTAVPKDANIVFAFNAKSIIEKSGLNNYQKLKSYSILEKEFTDKKSKLIKEFLQNTRSSGLNLDHIFAYSKKGDNNNPGMVITMKMDNKKTFESFLKKLDEDYETVIDDKGNSSYTNIDDKFQLKWNDKLAVLSYNATTLEVLDISEDNSILTVPDFKENYNYNIDNFIYLDQGSEFLKSLLNTGNRMNYYDIFGTAPLYEGTCFVGALNIEKGRFVLNYKLLPEQKINEIHEKYPFINHSFDNNIYKYFPNKALLASKLSVNPIEIYNSIKTNLTCSSKNIVNYNNTNEEHLDEVAKCIEKNDKIISQIANVFSGNLLLTIPSIEDNMLFQLYAAFSIKKDKEDELIQMIESSKNFIKNKEGYYTLRGVRPDMFQIVFAVKNNILYCTTNTESVKKFLNDESFSPNITSAKLDCDIKNDLMMCYFDLNINYYPAILKMMIG